MNNKIKIIVIEDDLVWSVFIESIINDSIYELVGAANTLTRAKAMIDGLKPDLLITDIMIHDLSVLSLLSLEPYKNIPTIFMTAHAEDEIYNQAQHHPKSLFLAKPFHRLTMLSTIKLFIDKHNILREDEQKYLEIFGNNQQRKRVPLNIVSFIEAEGNYIFINTYQKGKYARKISLNKVSEYLDNRFIRINKSHIINLDYVQRIELGEQRIYINDHIIHIGRVYREALQPYLMQKL